MSEKQIVILIPISSIINNLVEKLGLNIKILNILYSEWNKIPDDAKRQLIYDILQREKEIRNMLINIDVLE